MSDWDHMGKLTDGLVYALGCAAVILALSATTALTFFLLWLGK